MKKIYYAHSLDSKPQDEWQKLEVHLKNVAKLAGKFAESFGGSDWAELIGWLHDIGKYSKEFQNMLIQTTDNNISNEVKKTHIDHSTAGAKEVNRLFQNGFGKLLAYAIAGHHSGLMDGKSNNACLEDRLEKSNISDYSPYYSEKIKLNSNINKLPLKIAKGNNERIAFQLQFFIRMLFSSLVDADFLDTEAFMNKSYSLSRGNYPELSEMNYKLKESIKEISMNAPETLINKYRKDILRNCIDAADSLPGLFSLTVPTGGGKTLSSLAFAIRHALKYGMKRIIYVIPYTSIIEQNADVFRKIFGDEAILEHHSNVITNIDNYKYQLAIENWDAPLIVTTNVQFFESFFHNRTSKCRKLHNIANSVIILDEAQMLPINLLKPCMEVLRELTNSYNDTIILCTATQPALSENNEFVNGLKDVREIISEPEELCINLKRVEINCISNGNKKISDNELTKMIMKYNQVLCVVNTRHHARELYEKFDDKNGLYHLSALMCPVHRSEIISKIKNDLKNGKKCRVLSTQLIEAGVDIDFPVVFRSAAGIDSIAQSAGRCNREGKLSAGKVYIFYPEKDLPIGFLRQAAEEADAVMRKYSDLLSIEAINEYFRNLYWRNQDKLDKERILEKFLEGVGSINFPFREIAEQFKMMDSNMESIIIPYNDDAREIIKQLRYAEYVRKPACKAQRFSVQVYPHILKKLEGISVEKIRDNFFILTNEDLYSTDLGLNYDDPLFREAENNIF